VHDVEKQELRIKAIEDRARETEKLAAKMEANQSTIISTLEEMRGEMRGKVDK
jgi:proteasome assembly chaperone (PAC2) family protein